MLELKVYDGNREVVLQFEHSLLSLSKWESKHKKAFLADVNKLPTEMIDYYQDMLLSPEDRDLVYVLKPEQLDSLTKYINDTQTASSVPKDNSRGPKETTTSELIYYWLAALQIPFHPTETWHLNRVMMLVQIANFKQQPPEKTRRADLAARWKEMNAKNKERFQSEG